MSRYTRVRRDLLVALRDAQRMLHSIGSDWEQHPPLVRIDALRMARRIARLLALSGWRDQQRAIKNKAAKILWGNS